MIKEKYESTVQYMQINKHDTLHQQKYKNPMIISVDAEKPFDKIQHHFIIKLSIN